MDKKLQKVLDNFDLFSKNFIEITDNDGNRVKLQLNDAQMDINNILKKEKFLVIPKSRQAGITTEMLAMAIWKAVTKPNQNIMIVSYLGASAKTLFDKLKDMNNALPRSKFKGVFPSVKRENRSELLLSNGSRITSTTAGDKDIGRGETIDFILLSELAFYNDIDRQLLSVIQSLAKGAHSRLVIESTANGMNSFHELVMNAHNNKSRFKLYFIPFFHKLYLKQWKNEMDEAEDWYKTVHGSRLTKKDFDDDEKVLHKNGCSIRQLIWRRYKLLDMDLEEFHQEYPSTLHESFVSSGYSLFNQTKILERMNHLVAPLTRDELEAELPPSLMRFVGKGLDIFHLPNRKKRYYGGVDTSAGVGGDNSTVSLVDDEGQQVLSFYSNRLSPHNFAEVVSEIGFYYGYAYLCVERNSYGSVVIQQLREEYMYENLYKMKQFDQRGRRQLKLGFLTTESSKKMAISLFRQNFETGIVNIECKMTLEEMIIFVESANGKLGNKKGSNNRDDLVISMTLANVALAENKWYV